MVMIKIIKNHLQRMREIKYRKIIMIKIQEGKFKIIKLLKKGLERNQKRMKSVKIKYKKKKKKKRWSPQNPKEDGVEKKKKKKKKGGPPKPKKKGGKKKKKKKKKKS